MTLSERSQALRSTRVGASEVGAILGVDPYRGPMTVWSRIVLGEQQEQTPRMAIGAAFEAPIARLWAERNGHRVRMNRYTRTRGNLAATADGFVLDRGGLLEVKWSGGSYGLWSGPNLPEPVTWQAVAQAYVYRAPWVTVVALTGAELREWIVTPDRDQRRAVRIAVDLFFERYVDPSEMPIPLYPAELNAYLRLAQGTDPAARRPATDDEQRIALDYLAVRQTATAAKADADQLRDRLLVAIAQDAKPRVVGDGWTYQNDGTGQRIIDNRKDVAA